MENRNERISFFMISFDFKHFGIFLLFQKELLGCGGESLELQI